MSLIASINRRNINYEKMYLYLLIAFAFSIPISRALISFFTILLPLIWLIEGDFKRKFNQIKENKAVLLLSLFIIFGYISLSWTEIENIKDGFSSVTKTIRLVLIPLLIVITTLRPEHISKVITGFLMGMLISEILSYGIFFELWILPVGGGIPADPTPFMHHLDYSTFLTFTALLLLNRFFSTADWRLKAFYFVYFLFVTSNLFLNGGRTGHFAFAISIFVVGFLNIKNKFKAFFSMLLLVTAIFYAAYEISPVFKERFDAGSAEVSKMQEGHNSKYEGSFGIRLGAWIISKDIIKDNFFFGTGSGTENKKLYEYAKNHSDKSLQPIQELINFHNQYIQIFVRLGLIGIILYIFMWYYIGKLDIKERNISNLRYIFITVFFTASQVENIFENQFPMAMFALFIGIFIVMNKENEKFIITKREQI